jgi:hypothetical protein
MCSGSVILSIHSSTAFCQPLPDLKLHLFSSIISLSAMLLVIIHHLLITVAIFTISAPKQKAFSHWLVNPRSAILDNYYVVVN